ncbi:hypothetical protein [Pseudoalteromonas rubra]|uniref:hypothetical protein n=1 Tax=Pseudoalteromonas rubra TaxID=43658 RepID=UPI002DBA5861|nr:hypothetical protein [Pseudoalteromonas rubra]MEC4091890.1 hypothetical protein [Pseudoalteromonas rubra]
MKKTILLLIALLTISLFYLNSGLGFKFTEIVGAPEERAIKHRFSDYVAVQAAIIDYRIEGNYAFGFRLPAYDAYCEDGKYTSLLLSLEGVFFIFNLNDELYMEFKKEREFYKHLASLGLKQNLNLNSSQLNDVVQGYEAKYKEFGYFDTCKPM